MIVRSIKTSFFIVCYHWLALACASAAPDLGDFTAQSDVGEPGQPSSAHYDSATQSYQVSGAGKNVWAENDDFNFVWRKVSGDFIIQSRARLVGAGTEAHRKMGLMIRSSLDTGSAMISTAVHGDGLTSLQFRSASAATVEEIK